MSDEADFHGVRFLTFKQVLSLHEQEIRDRGGQSGIRDERLLWSALAQPMMQFGGEYLHGDLFEMAAAYAFHIAGNHPFVDGNKRAALAAALMFLDGNGYCVREKGTALADMLINAIEKHRSKQWIANRLRRLAEPV